MALGRCQAAEAEDAAAWQRSTFFSNPLFA
jgi:hypothetical protein